MRNIPDFAMQVLEIEKGISGQADLSAECWKDNVQRRFYERFIEQYFKDMEIYIHGGTQIVSKGLNDLLVFIDEKLGEMERLTGVPADVSFTLAAIDNYAGGNIIDNRGLPVDVEDSFPVRMRGGVVHNERLDRDYWRKEYGADPGEMKSGDVKEVMEEREKNH